ncbi:MAG: SEL1-like repeat protein [Proteobacteria bacterium]|nr:SEL1-like repeat protein [Pseudomonadota bacterium]
MAQAGARAHINQNEEAYEEEDEHALDPSLDTALRLAHHAQRLKAMEISMENLAHALHAFKADQRHLFRRQTIISLIIGAICLAATAGGMALAGKHSRAVTAPPPVAAAGPVAPAPMTVTIAAPVPVAANPVPVAPAAPQPAPVVIENPAPPPVAMGRYEQAPKPAVIPRPLSAFETAVAMRLSATSQTLPESWKPIFDRETSGDKRAKLQVAAKFLKGDGVRPDPAFAVSLIRQGAEGGNREAMMWLAYSYEAGTFGKPDFATAARWFQEAAKSGVTSAFGELGKLYEKGIDGAPDPETALAWYQRAQAAGDTKAAAAVQRLRRSMMSENVQLAAEPNGPAPAKKASVPDPAAAPSRPAILTPARIARTPEGRIPDSVAAARAPMSARELPVPEAQDEAPAAAEEQTADPERMADIRAAQRMLKVLGYKIDKPDGALGPQTIAAIKAYQRDHAAYPDGQFSSELLESLTQEIRFGN